MQVTVLESGHDMFQTQLTDIEFGEKQLGLGSQSSQQVAAISYNGCNFLITS